MTSIMFRGMFFTGMQFSGKGGKVKKKKVLLFHSTVVWLSLCMNLHWNWIASRSSRIFITICIMWPIAKLPTFALIHNPLATQNLSILYINSYYPVCLQWQSETHPEVKKKVIIFSCTEALTRVWFCISISAFVLLFFLWFPWELIELPWREEPWELPFDTLL